MKSILITATLLFSVLFQNTYAQEDKTIQREGFVFGTSYGTGYSTLKFPDKNQSDLGSALDFKIGYMINPNFAVLLTSSVSIYDYSGYGRARKRDFGILSPAGQFWINDALWVLGGVGLGGDNPVFWDIKNPDTDPLETKYYKGLGFVTAVGYEIYQKKNIALDLKTKLTYRNVEMQESKTSGVSIALLLGINFH